MKFEEDNNTKVWNIGGNAPIYTYKSGRIVDASYLFLLIQ